MSSARDILTATVVAKLDEIIDQFAELEQRLEAPEVLSDHNLVREISIKKAALEPVAAGYQRILAIEAELVELGQVIGANEDAELVEMARAEVGGLEDEAVELAQRVVGHLVTTEDRKVGSVMLEIRAGTGGDEAGLWARDLLAMYERYAASQGWKIEMLEMSVDDGTGGVRSAIANLRGEGVWAELCFEAGVHSVKRVPMTESQGRIHTSTATVAVLPEPEQVQVNIDWATDVQEHITTAQGPGGQNVNKVATACHLIHKPTGIEVRMQESKSQHQNREKARRLLMARVFDLEQQKISDERASQRSSQIGSGGRSEKIRTYRYQEGIVVDQRLDERFNLQKTLNGELAPMMQALIQQEIAQRLAAL